MNYIMEQAIISLLLTNPNPSAYTVQVDPPAYNWNYHFAPHSVTIKSGDTVTWINIQEGEHKLVLQRAPAGVEYFESPVLNRPRDAWSYRFTSSGTYVYRCGTHPDSVSAVVIVGKPSQPFEIRDVQKQQN